MDKVKDAPQLYAEWVRPPIKDTATRYQRGDCPGQKARRTMATRTLLENGADLLGLHTDPADRDHQGAVSTGGPAPGGREVCAVEQ